MSNPMMVMSLKQFFRIARKALKHHSRKKVWDVEQQAAYAIGWNSGYNAAWKAKKGK